MDVEYRLNAFRRERDREESWRKFKTNALIPIGFMRRKMSQLRKNEVVDIECEEEDSETASLINTRSDNSFDEPVEEFIEDEEKDSLLGLHGAVKCCAYFCLWMIPYILLIKVGFGAVYFCLTALIFIYYNTRTRPKLINEPSAYSVFNKDCAPLDGALSSEQVENQIRMGILS